MLQQLLPERAEHACYQIVGVWMPVMTTCKSKCDQRERKTTNFRVSVTKLQPHPFHPVNNNQTAILWGITNPTALFFPLFLAWLFMNLLKMFTEKVPSAAGSWLPILVFTALAKWSLCFSEHHLGFSELKGREMLGNLEKSF